MEFKENLKKYQNIINEELEKYLRKENCPEKTLNDSMEYSLMAGGKRLRPILVLATYELFRESYEEAMPFAVAIEMIHNFSLIHDDLPEVDNDDFRHGKPTNHKQFNHPTALLAGDGLLNQAYIVLSDEILYSVENQYKESFHSKVKAFNEFTKAVDRMIAGEYLDTELEGKQISKEMLEYIHINKTGALLKLCVRMGAILAEASEDDIERLSKYADKIGLAFQIKDDIFDYFDNRAIGKPTGNDMLEGKLTLPALYVLNTTKNDEAQELAIKVKEGAATLDEIAHLISFIKENGGIEYAVQTMNVYKQKAFDLLASLPESDICVALRAYLDYVVDREK